MFMQVMVVSAAAVMVFGAGVARADTLDDKYLAALASQDITGDPAQLIADGHAACDNYGSAGVVGEMLGLEGRGMSNVQATNVFITGIKAYCPEKSSFGSL